jgi:hypothetical protein
MMAHNNLAPKSAWVEPEVLILDITDTALFPNRGSDASRHLDCTRS